MGAGYFTSRDWSDYKARRGFSASSTVSDYYTRRSIKDDFDPKNIKVRESCDSADHPESTPIILGLDVTGSMGSVLTTISKKLNVLIQEILDREPVKDPQIMVMAFGDTECDRYPLQVTQFESDIRIAEQLNDIYFERGGGGNDGESYSLPWYFAARKTKTDAYLKRNKKGYLFTMGDEKYLDVLGKDRIKYFIGDDVQANLTAEELYNEVSKQYVCYHLLIEEGCGMRVRGREVIDKWQNLMGQYAIPVADCTKIPEIIVSILQVEAGKDKEAVTKSWDKSTALVVDKAIKNLEIAKGKEGLIEF
ncbi:MAG: hypothetical protein MJ112_04080 [Lachnospiraceae bacterium]|nr:hypothetical protein [Lachnospiraceae bacterium]